MCSSTHTNENSLIDIGVLAHGTQHSLKGELCLKSRKSHLDTVSTGSGSDLVNRWGQESLGISHADHGPGRYRSLY
jgi:hypothetical protein